jgi:hypothetical protein
MKVALTFVAAAAMFVGACGSSDTPSGASTPSRGASTTSGAQAASGTPTSGPLTPVPGQSAVPSLAGVEMATSLAANGSAADPRTTFTSSSDRKIIAVLDVRNLEAGTKLSFIRYLEGKLVDSRSATIAKKADYFYFEFSAQPGKNITPGQYRLRLYVKERAAWEVTYQVV